MSLAFPLQDLKQPEASYRKLGAKMVVGLPFKEIATTDTIYMAELPPASDKEARRALTRLQVCCCTERFWSASNMRFASTLATT